MESFEKVEKILAKLPVAYYLKRKLDVKLSNCSSSYMDIFNNTLVVSYTQLSSINNLTENDVRCMLYHEVSHALLTPLALTINDIINIFEDERIETVCSNMYYGVDFKAFCKKINNASSFVPSNEMQYFYQVVRFRKGEAKFLKEVERIIRKYYLLNTQSYYQICASYANDIKDLYNDIRLWFSSNEAKKIKDNAMKNDRKEDSKTDTEDDDDEENALLDSQAFQPTASDITDEEKEKAISSGINAINSEFMRYENKELQNTFERLLVAKKKFNKMNGAAINAYSGVFDARSTARDDYKYFVQKSRLGNIKRFSKIKMNLFIDNSGSFCQSETVVNKMLFNLQALEKRTSDFSFDVVTMSNSEKLLQKNERKIHCFGGNRLDEKIIEIYNNIQSKDALNINIVLFDGDACSAYCKFDDIMRSRKNFKAFNHENCYIISDDSNEKSINMYCKQAKKTILSSNYASTLIDAIIKNIQQHLK